MNVSLASIRRKLSRAYGLGGRVSLLLDYDGTLAKKAARPALAILSPEGHRVLEGFAALPRVCLGIVSARTLGDLKALVGIEQVDYAGVFGMELELNGTRYYHPKAWGAVIPLTQFTEHFEASLPDFPGVWIERKAFGVAIHHGTMDSRLLNSLICRARQTMLMTSLPLKILHDWQSLEIIPDVNCHKGTAVCAMAHVNGVDPADVLFAGDDQHDAEAFDIVSALGGSTVGVGDEVPGSAQVRIKDPAAMIAFLGELLDDLSNVPSKTLDFAAEASSFNRS